MFRPTSPRTQQIPESTTLCGADNAKLLGVWISKDLKFSKHIDEVKKDLNYSISILWRLRKVLNGRILRTIADGLVMSKIRYCAAVWGSE